MHDIVIVGAGGFGREVLAWLRDAAGLASSSTDPFRVKGFLSQDPHALDNFQLDVEILGYIPEYTIEENDRFLVAIGDIHDKMDVIGQLQEKGAKFTSFVHPSALVAASAKIGEGVIICPFALVSDHVVVGDHAMLNFYASCGHDSVVGTGCVLSPYATLNGYSVLENEVFLGTHATVAGRRRIGHRSKIAANSAAMRDVPPRTFVEGVPGRLWTIFDQ
jgi:sugar O-acyltransferase (sialic acid O-acetyltransferase NeuD family)